MVFKKKIIIKILEKKYLKKLNIFLEKNYKKNYIINKNKKFFNWQHKIQNRYSSFIAIKNSKVIGSQSYISFRSYDNKQKKNDIFLALWVALEKEGVGIGYQLYKQIIKEEDPNFIGTIGLRKELLKFHAWQGFTLDKMKHFVFLLDYKKPYKICHIPKNIKIKNKYTKKDIEFKKINLKNIENIKPNKIFSYQVPIKSIEYIKNRYLKHPIYTYEVFTCYKDKKISSIFVLRESKYKNSSCLKVIDFIGEKKEFFNIKNLLIRKFKENPFEYANIYVYGLPISILKQAGFIDVEKSHNIIIPQHFEPYTKKNIKILCGFKTNDKKSKVRMFNSDCDQDRPN